MSQGETTLAVATLDADREESALFSFAKYFWTMASYTDVKFDLEKARYGNVGLSPANL